MVPTDESGDMHIPDRSRWAPRSQRSLADRIHFAGRALSLSLCGDETLGLACETEAVFELDSSR